MKVFLFILGALAAVQAQGNSSKLVNIAQGPVRGYKMPGLDVFAFYSIPYAKAPSGRDKYKPPLPAPTWTTPFEATEKNVLCHQFNIFPPGMFEYVEDCLVVSVYTPDTNATNLPVVVVIHGGGFQSDFGNYESPSQLVDQGKNIIGVTLNYRLGPIGFLCLGTPDVPGNAGMRDQLAALKWVQQNIAAFGGNPNDVTIAGCSAGGASVDLHMLSKASRGLFHKIIGQSGGNIGAFAVQVDPTASARKHARDIGYTGPDTLEGVEEFYKSIPYEQLLSKDLHENKDVSIVMAPCVERDIGIERFLEETPISIIKKGDYIRYPVLYGWAAMEGIFRLEYFENWKKEMNEDFTNFMPTDLQFNNDEHKRQVSDKVKQFYFGGNVTNDNIIRFVDYNSDVMFNVAMQRAVTIQVENGHNAMYISVYSFTDNNTEVIPHTNVRGANHCDQTVAVLDLDLNSNFTPEFIEMRRSWRAVWLNFIHTGNPTPDGNIPPLFPKWEAASANRTPCMDIGNPIRIYPGPFDLERQKFWDEIYDQYKKEPVPPYDFNGAGQTLFRGIFLSVVISVITTYFF